MSQPIEQWLSEYVNDPFFASKLAADIDALEKPADRVKARMELLSYLAPKVKTIDPLSPDQTLDSIEIKYVVAKPPKAKAADK